MPLRDGHERPAPDEPSIPPSLGNLNKNPNMPKGQKQPKSQLELTVTEGLALRRKADRTAIKIAKLIEPFPDDVQDEILHIVHDSLGVMRNELAEDEAEVAKTVKP